MDVLTDCQIMYTNTGAKTPQKAVQRAKVIFLVETHGERGKLSVSERANTLAVNHLFRKGDLLLVEKWLATGWQKEKLVAPIKRLNKLDSQSIQTFIRDAVNTGGCDDCPRGFNELALKEHCSWDISRDHMLRKDLQTFAAFMIIEDFGKLCSLSKFAYRVLHDDKLINKKKFDKPKDRYSHILQRLQRRGSSLLNTWDSKNPVKAIHALMLDYGNTLKKDAEAIEASGYRKYSKRNASMLQKILAYKGKGRIFVTAGALHLKYGDPEAFSAIDVLYNGLKARNIPYVALQPRTQIMGPVLSKEEALKKAKAKQESNKDLYLHVRANVASSISLVKQISPTLVFEWVKEFHEKLLGPRSEWDTSSEKLLAHFSTVTQIVIEEVINYTWPKSKL